MRTGIVGTYEMVTEGYGKNEVRVPGTGHKLVASPAPDRGIELVVEAVGSSAVQVSGVASRVGDEHCLAARDLRWHRGWGDICRFLRVRGWHYQQATCTGNRKNELAFWGQHGCSTRNPVHN